MGIQIASLSMGGAAYVEPQEIRTEVQQRRQENRRPLPPGGTETDENAETPLAAARRMPDLKQVSAELEHISHAFDRRLKFVIDQDSREVIIKVIDNETDTVIKELPPEELRRLHEKISETIGFLFDRTI